MPRPVLLYDGKCGLCQALVGMLLRADRSGRLSYALLQSAPAQAYLRAQGLPTADFDSLVFVPDWNDPTPGDYRLRTDGVCAALREIGALGRMLAWGRWVPRSWRDGAYKVVARWRYALFGQYRPKPLLKPEWQERFL